MVEGSYGDLLRAHRVPSVGVDHGVHAEVAKFGQRCLVVPYRRIVQVPRLKKTRCIL